MKRIFYLLAFTVLISACRSSRDYLERSNEDAALQDAVKRLKKDPNDDKALEAVPVLYPSIQKTHLARIQSYKTSPDINRWDKIISEYLRLQEAYDAIIGTTAAFKLVTPVSYAAELIEAREKAAEDHYQHGLSFLKKDGRDNAQKAYNAFVKSDSYVTGYKDASARAKEAYTKATVKVVVNPVQDNSFFSVGSWGNYGMGYTNEYFQYNLVRELEYSSDRYAAKFYTDDDARQLRIIPDWTIDLRLRNLDIPYPSTSTYRRNASAQVEIGRDTANRPVYKTVYATVNITRMFFTARADMEVLIREAGTGRNIYSTVHRDDFRWQEERATYSGDSRALSENDWQLIHNNYNQPRKEDILQELYRDLYPQVLSSVRYAVRW